MSIDRARLLIAALCFLCVSSSVTDVQTADLKRSSDAEQTARFVPLFNGRDLSGWETTEQYREDWLVHDRAIYCTGRFSTLKYTAKKLPRDFELRFSWRSDKPRLFAGFYGSSGGNVWFVKRHTDFVDERVRPPRRGLGKKESISYDVAGSRICVVAVADKIVAPTGEEGHSQTLRGQAGGDFDRPQGEWNEGSIRCIGTRIECRRNGGVVFQYEASGKAAEEWAAGPVAGDWVAAKKSGLELTINCIRNPIWVRDVFVADLTPTVEPSTALRQAPEVSPRP